MFKLLFRLLALVVILLLIGGVALYFYLNTLVKDQVEAQGTRATGVATTLSGVNLRPFRGGITLDEFALANPQGFSDEKLFAFDSADVRVQLGSLLGDEVVIPRLHINGATVRVALQGRELNIKKLLDNIQQRGESEDVETGEEHEDAEAMDYVVNDLRITNTRVIGELTLIPNQPPLQVDLTLADIVKQDVRGAEMADVIAFVVETVLLNSSRSLMQVSPDLDQFVGGLRDTADKAIDDATGRIEEVLPGAGGLLNERGKQEVGKALGDLLGNKKDEDDTPAE